LVSSVIMTRPLGGRDDGGDTPVRVRPGVLPEPHRGGEDRRRLLPERRPAGGAGWPLVRRGRGGGWVARRRGGEEGAVLGGQQHDQPADGGAAAGPGTWELCEVRGHPQTE